MNKVKCAVICDIRKSRQLENWRSVIHILRERLDEINEKFRSEIMLDFGITAGDEFQGVLKSPKNVYDLYLHLKVDLPVKLYCGLGVGEVETSESIAGARGSAFYRARESLELCKRKQRGIMIKSWMSDHDNILNVLFHFIEVFEDSWTNRQREVVNYCRFHPELTYEEIGKHFSVTKQSISQTLKSAGWSALREGEELIRKLLLDYVKL